MKIAGDRSRGTVVCPDTGREALRTRAGEPATPANQPQRSLLDALEPIDPRTLVDRIPGIDAPCICDPHRRESCGWPYCGWKTHLREQEDA